MSNFEKFVCRLMGALILASVGTSAGVLLAHYPNVPMLWFLPIAIVHGAAIATGFILLWLNRIERYRD